MSRSPSDEGAPPVCPDCVESETLDPSAEAPTRAPIGPAGAVRPRVTPDGRLMSGKLAGKSMWGAIWVLSWPVMVESYLNSFVGLIDTMLAARISPEATDAIGAAAYFVWFISLIGMALGVGATALVARSVGKGRLATANAAVGQTVLLSVVLGIVVGAVLAQLAPSIARLLHLEPAAGEAFGDYLRIVSAGVPLSALLFSGIACLRGAGDAIRPLWAMVVVNFVNIILSWWLAGVPIAGVTPPASPEFGLTGIALGTVAAHAVGGLVILSMLIRGRGGVTLKRRRLVPHMVTVSRLFRIGLPNFLESLGMWVGNFIVMMMVGAIGVAVGAEGLFGAHILAIRVEAFSFLPGFAMGTAVATLAGQYLGAGSPQLAKRAILRCTVIGASVMACMGAAFILAPEMIVRALSPQEVHAELAPPLLVICGFVQIPFAIALVIRSALRGAGDVKVVMWMTWASTYLVRLPLAWLLSGVDVTIPARLAELFGADGPVVIANPSGREPSLDGLWLGLCVELGIRGALFAARFLQGGWQKVRV